ncbi:MAG: hypothetical protein CL918_03505 [Deltaproteobacteria bacterium]|nr:hypothetical protein [Deltaproteobacteria bacterium]|tara:strand:- start:5770 stop:6054 length:285 start_codon:yes stop_codon:yes gene_type:complete
MTKDKIDFDDLQRELARSRRLSQGDRLNVMESLATFAQRQSVLTKEVKTLFKLLKKLKDNQDSIAKALNQVLIHAENKELWIEISKEEEDAKSL